MDRKFKVGERLRIAHEYPGVFFNTGDVVKVMGVTPSPFVSLPYNCRRIDDGKNQYVSEGQLVPVDSTVAKHSSCDALPLIETNKLLTNINLD